jgi:Tfp pilus assembly protein PilV
MAARRSRGQRGISLIEAMVALAVMAFGTLAVLGVQATLRFNGDVAKQRSEAVRIAQEALEDWRAFATLDDYEAVDTSEAAVVEGYTTNTSFELVRTVQTASTDIDGAVAPRRKTLVVDVIWTDRADQVQSVRLSSSLHGLVPEFAGSLAVPADAAYTRNPSGRNPTIPQEAVDQGDGTSRFAPPGAPDSVRWTFNNTTGTITQLCDTCDPVNARLLAGYVRFALTTVQPTPQDAEIPPSSAESVGVTLAQTAPVGVPAPSCYRRLETAYVAYYCAVQIGTGTAWSGTAGVTGLSLATNATDASNLRRRVCRYTKLIAGVPSLANADHPAVYANVGVSLLNKNFLVIPSGNGATTSYTCPGDDTATPYLNGQTWQHQPAP